MNRPNGFARLRPVDPGILRGKAMTADGHLSANEITSVVRTLQKTMHACGAVGLAAPQLGLPARIAVMEDELFAAVFVDPTVHPFGKAEEKVAQEEGCLSLPGRRFMVKRHPAVRVNSHIDPRYPITYMLRGFLARVAQHELDHLDGLLIDAIGEEVPAQQELEASA